MLQAYYRPDKMARAMWLGRLKEREYPVEVLRVRGKVMPKADVKTQKGVVIGVPLYCVVYQRREGK